MPRNKSVKSLRPWSLLAAVAVTAIAAPGTAPARQVIYVANADSIGEYNAVTGATINAALVNGQGLNSAYGLAYGAGNLYVSNGGFNGGGSLVNTVGEYNATTGATINSAFINGQGLNAPSGLALDGNNNLFVVSTPVVGQYNATTGATINPLFLNHGLVLPIGIALDGNNHMFVANGNDTVGEYNATTGATINATLINGQGLSNPGVIEYDALGHLFVANFGTNISNGSVGEYDAVTGATINANLVGLLAQPTGIALDNANHLFVAYGNNLIGEFNATTGAVINPTFVDGQGLNGPEFMVFVPAVPEPGSMALVGVAAAAAVGWRIRRRQRTSRR
jgi:PEP-CTERM motif